MLKIYVNTWGNYNENGAEGGEWITLPMDSDELEELKERMKVYTEKARKQLKIDMMYFMLTNILTETTDLICMGPGADQLIFNAFHMEDEEAQQYKEIQHIINLPGVVSRKKQLAPQIMMALQQ